jgi:hypothetical protein
MALKTGDLRFWYFSLILAGLSFVTLEVAFVLIASLILLAFQERSALRVNSGFMLRSIAVFLATVAAVHPASLFKLSFVKAYAIMVYLAVFRKSPWGDATLTGTWLNRFEHAPVEWALVLAAAILFLRAPDSPARRYSRAPLYFSVLMILVTLRVLTTDTRYLLPFTPVLAIFSAWMLGEWISTLVPKLQVATAALICALLFVNSSIYGALHPLATDEDAVQLIAAVRNRHLEQSTLIIPHDEIPAFHYYFPQATVKSYLDEGEMNTLAVAEKADALVRPDLSLELR